MAGLGLVHVGFLFAAAAVAVPILIHLLFRPRARRVEIGSVRFLKLVLRDSARRRRLRRWLLLALRVAAVLLLALLFARPYWSRAGNPSQGRDVILLIDQSASMSATQGGRTLFARAQEAAEQVIRGVPHNTTIHLAYFDARGVVPAAEPRIEGSRDSGYAGTDYLHALRWARDIAISSRRPQQKIYLFTDLQRSGVHSTHFDGLPAAVELEVVEVGKPLMANLAVESIEAIDAVIRPKQPLVVVANLLNAGPFPAKNVQARLILEGESGRLPVQGESVAIAPGSRQTVRFSTLIQKPGLYKGYVEITNEDEFALDNRRYLAFEARTPERILLVDGEPGSSVYGNETYYLEAALRLRLPHKGGSLTPYEPERLVWESGALLPDLGNFRIVVLCNVAAMYENDLVRLRSYVAGGGRLLVFTGKHVQPEGYVALERAGLLPARVVGPLGPDLFRFDHWDKEHPILKPLSDPQQGDLRRVVFHHITGLKPHPDAKVLATTQTGEPLLIEGQLDRGRILLFASTADREWSNWPQSRLYVPLVHQLVGYLTERLPENQRVQETPAGSGKDMEPGITAHEKIVVVRSLDPKESEIERLSEEEFRKAYHLPALDGRVLKHHAAAAVEAPAGTERPDEVWTYVIWILLVVLIGELLIANRTRA